MSTTGLICKLRVWLDRAFVATLVLGGITQVTEEKGQAAWPRKTGLGGRVALLGGGLDGLGRGLGSCRCVSLST